MNVAHCKHVFLNVFDDGQGWSDCGEKPGWISVCRRCMSDSKR